MNFVFAVLAWLLIGTVIGVGIFMMAVKGSPWLFVIATLAFIAAVGKIGCSTH